MNPESWYLRIVKGLRFLGKRKPGRHLAHARVRLMRACCIATAGSRVGRIPENNLIRSIPEIMHRPAVSRHVTEIREIWSAHAERYAFPAHYPPEFLRDNAYDARYSYALTDVVVGPASGVFWFPEGPVLQESVGSLIRMLSWSYCRQEMLRKPVPLATSGPLVPLPATGYFHWLLETLPTALRAFDASPDATLLVHPDSPRYVWDGVRLFFSALQQCDIAVSERPVAVGAAQLVAIDEYCGFVAAADVVLLRERAGAHLQQSGSEGGKLLFVSRRLARARAEVAPPSLDEALRDLGYEVVVAETLDLADQIKLFSSAGGIVGLHGAGLANMIWAPPGCRIVELFPPGVFNDCYGRLALTCGHSYRYEVLEPTGLESSQLRRLSQDP